MIKKIYKNKLLLVFLLSFLLGCLIVIPNIIAGGGIYHLVADFDVQEIPFNKLINYSIKNNSFLWTWYNDFGSNFIATFSFYNLFSPFNLLGFIFPDSWFEYLIGPIFILKYAFCGLCSYIFLKRYVKNKDYAVIGSLLYTFSGFQLTNILFYHFHDVVVFFPLLLYGLDRLVYDNKKGLFALVIFISAITNWFFFIGECLFLVIYYFVKVICKDYNFNIKNFFNIIFEGFLGIMMAMFVLVPTLIFTLGNPRVSADWTFIEAIKHPFIRYLEILRAFVLAPETMSNRSILEEANYNSIEFYLPVVGLVLAFSYLIKNPKKAISIIFVVSVIIMFIPILNSSFFLFNTHYYARWIFMPLLISSLMSVKCIEENIPIKKGIIMTVIIFILLILGIFAYSFKYPILVNNYLYVFIIIIVSFIGYIYTFLIYRKKNNFIFFVIGIFIYISLFGNYMVYNYKNNNIGIDNSLVNFLKYDDNYKILNNTRTNSSRSCPANIGYTKRIANIKSFNSNISPSIFTFLNSLEIERIVSTEISIEEKELNDLLGVRYIISCDDDTDKYGYEYYDELGDYSLYVNNEALDIGYTVSNYLSYDDYNILDINEKISVLKDNVILSKEQIEKYSDLFPNDGNIIKHNFSYVNNGFEVDIDVSEDSLLVLQIPYDKGWSATLNGKNIKVENVDNGFIAIKVNKGDNNIKFSYHVPGLFYGICISIVFIGEYILYILFNRNKRLKV